MVVQTKVSMVVPCYNKIDWVRPMFDSVLAQVWDNIELILVNDGSTDGTREVIAEYEPRFIDRGYEVVIVDQENQGVAAAVKHGLMRVTGEYVCMPDCDDVLDAEYVSAMAGLLRENADFDCVVCDYQSAPLDQESSTSLKKSAPGYNTASTYPYKLLESVLTARFSPSACTGLFKLSTLRTASVIENYVVQPRISQEAQLWLPLALNNAHVLHYHRVLYDYTYKSNVSSISRRDRHTAYTEYRDFLKQYHEIIAETLKSFMNHTTHYDLLVKIRIAYTLCSFAHREGGEHETFYLHEMLGYIAETNTFAHPIIPEQASRAGVAILYRYFSNHVIGYHSDKIHIARKGDGKLIAYAAFGMASRTVKCGLLNSDIRPDAYWDIAAKPGDAIDGIPVYKPDFDALTANDTVLVLLKDVTIASKVKAALEQTPAKENVWYYYDVLDYLADYYFA